MFLSQSMRMSLVRACGLSRGESGDTWSPPAWQTSDGAARRSGEAAFSSCSAPSERTAAGEAPARAPGKLRRVLGRSRWKLDGGVRSEGGSYRAANEDACYANLRDGLFLIADGIGGRRGGAAASQLLVDTIPPLVLSRLHAHPTASREMEWLIAESVAEAHSAMAKEARRDPMLSDMGSTLVLGILAGGSLFLTHSGDSRAYLVRGGEIHQLTVDHSLVQVMIEAGELTSEQARHHRLRHVILESISAKLEAPRLSIQEIPLCSGDQLLFATDGLTDVVGEEFLVETMAGSESPQEAADRLVEQALALDSKDNVSCVVVHVGKADF